MDKEELIIDAKTVSPTGLNPLILVRFVILTIFVALGLKIIIKKIFETKRKIDLIDKIPGEI